MSTSVLDRLDQPPFTGWFCLLVVFSGLALGHAGVVLQWHLTGAPSALDTVVSFALGTTGVVLVWAGLKKPENQATWLGYMGGNLIWVGLFEWTWHYFSHWLHIEPVMDKGMPILSPGLLMIQATGLLVIVLLILFGANKDTRCRMFMWFHRNLRLRPGQMTPGYKRQFSRITALETVFLIWFIYLCAIMINDPRLIGYDSMTAIGVTVGFLVWGTYLVSKLLKIRGLGAALRYAIPTGNILWLPIEAFSRWGIYPEIWIKPMQFPITMSLVLLAFAAAGAVILRRRRPDLPAGSAS
ncbi:MAG: hypothetical protein L6Q83_05010 [Gammaproteobacteria bacterium]|jgi:hypothetical protein|nr:hypothetical protein [Gammaproteobacteria bacterium]